MKLTNEELKNLPKNCFDFNGRGGAVINKDIIKSICEELLTYREKALFDEDQKKIEDSVEYHAMGSYQIGELARLSALLYDRGVDVIKEIEKLHYKFGIEKREDNEHKEL